LQLKVDSLTYLGLSAYALGHYNKDLDYYNQSLEIAQRIGDVSTEGACHYNLSRLYLDLYDKSIADNTSDRQHLKTAYRHLNDSISVNEKIGSNLVDDTIKINYHDKYINYYELAVFIAYCLAEKWKYNKEAFELVQRSKSKAFIDLMSSNIDIKLNLKKGNEDKDRITNLIEIEKSLLNEKKLVQLQSIINSKGKKFQEFGGSKPNDILQIVEKLNNMYVEMGKINPEYVSLRKPKPLTLSKVKDRLNYFFDSDDSSNVLLVEYFVTYDGTYIFCIHDKKLVVHKDKNLTRNKLSELMSEYDKQIPNYPDNKKNGNIMKDRSVFNKTNKRYIRAIKFSNFCSSFFTTLLTTSNT
jgi:hypothetical protein